MSISDVEQEIQTICIQREISIAAPIEVAFEAMLEELGPGGEMPDGKPFPMVIEPWPGGRWYRDLGHNRPPLGARPGHQAADAPRAVRADVHVLPRRQPRAVPVDGRRRGHAAQVHAPGRWGRSRTRSGRAWDRGGTTASSGSPRSRGGWRPSGERGRSDEGDRPGPVGDEERRGGPRLGPAAIPPRFENEILTRSHTLLLTHAPRECSMSDSSPTPPARPARSRGSKNGCENSTRRKSGLNSKRKLRPRSKSRRKLKSKTSSCTYSESSSYRLAQEGRRDNPLRGAVEQELLVRASVRSARMAP